MYENLYLQRFKRIRYLGLQLVLIDIIRKGNRKQVEVRYRSPLIKHSRFV